MGLPWTETLQTVLCTGQLQASNKKHSFSLQYHLK